MTAASKRLIRTRRFGDRLWLHLQATNPPTLESVARMLEILTGEQQKFHDEVRGFMRQSQSRYESVSSDLGVLKGGYAFETTLGNAGRIAYELGFQFIAAMPRQELDALADLVADSGEQGQEAQSFRNADLVMLVQRQGEPAVYMAVEVSYQVGAVDIRRAKRNAEYLSRYTPLQALGAVVGVRMPETIRHQADAEGVLRYLLRPT